MELSTLILYIMCVALFFLYIIAKYKKRLYILSTFNIGVFIYTFALFISPIFLYADESWAKLRIEEAGTMLAYTNESIKINAIGYIIFILVLILVELSNLNVSGVVSLGKKVSRNINELYIDVIFCFFVIVWYAICFVYCKGLPLLNGQRTFYLYKSISPVYLFANEVILFCTFYYGITYVKEKRKLLFLLLGWITIAFQGNRAALILNSIFPFLIILVYQRVIDYRDRHSKAGVNREIDTRRGKTVVIRWIGYMVPILVIFGLWLQFVRSGNSAGGNLLAELIYGNTFSDIRDGAYILKGFQENTASQFLHGKSYGAALISFVPSSISQFRVTWSWGRYTTMGLFGMGNHFGLRGGNVMEAYINFNWVGVVLFSVLQGVLMGLLEKIFYLIFIKEKMELDGKEYFVYNAVYLLYGVLVASSSAYNVYVIIIFVVALVFASGLSRQPKVRLE